MAKKRFRWLSAAAAVAAVATAAVLVTGAYGGSKANGGIIIDGTTGTVVNIDPANEYDYDSFTVDLLMFQGLYGFPHGAKLAPVLATGCSHSKDLKTWTCQLRHGVKFANGDSDDVGRREVLVRPRAEDQGRPGHLHPALVPEEHVDERAVQVIFHLTTAATPIWPYILSTNAGYVVDMKTFPGEHDPGEHRRRRTSSAPARTS